MNIKFCHINLQVIFNFHVGGGERTVNTQTQIYFYSLRFCKVLFMWGKGQLLGIEQCLDRALIGVTVLKAQNSVTTIPRRRLYGSVCIIADIYNTVSCPTSLIAFAHLLLLCFSFFIFLRSFFCLYRWVWKHFRQIKHLSRYVRTRVLCKVILSIKHFLINFMVQYKCSIYYFDVKYIKILKGSTTLS